MFSETCKLCFGYYIKTIKDNEKVITISIVTVCGKPYMCLLACDDNGRGRRC